MNHPFENGESFQNTETKQTIFILAIASVDLSGALLAAGTVDENTKKIGDIGELFIKTSDYSKWIKREL